MKELRLFKRPRGPFCHAPVLIAGGGGKDCAFCKGERKTRFECSTCKVPLCVALRKDGSCGDKSHFDRWHTAVDLEEESKMAVEETRESKEKATEETE